MASKTAQAVSDHYSSIALESPSKTNKEHIEKVAQSFGYTAEELSSIPEGANLGVSCGNPLAIAGLKPGETVIDLGSGAGFDIFLAAQAITPSGLAIGIDSNPSMLARARLNASLSSPPITNVKFILAPITALPLPSNTADCVISNCVINLLEEEEKKVCFREVWRVLKEGGRVAISDILAKKKMGKEMRGDLGLWVGCVGGASEVGEYEGWLRDAGFEDILIVDKHSDLNIYKERGAGDMDCCGEESKDDKSCPCDDASSPCSSSTTSAEIEERKERAKRVKDIDFNEWVSSYGIYAIKPITS